MKKITLFLTLMAMVTIGFAQVQTPQPSPSSTIKQTVGLTEVTVDYSRPSMKGRTIFGDLVPFGTVWRTGANASTDITFSEAVQFGGTDVPAGTYALYTKPGESSWDVMLYSDADQWGAPRTFDESLVVASATVTPTSMASPVETFSIGFDHLTNNSAHLTMAWENTHVAVPFTVHTQKSVEESIEKVMAGPSSNDYFSAARYYLEEGLDMEKALGWVNQAVELRPEAFWIIKTKSEIQAKMGDFKGAIATAKQSLELATTAGNNNYINGNKENIEKWMGM